MSELSFADSDTFAFQKISGYGGIWETRSVEGAVPERAWRFESSYPHMRCRMNFRDELKDWNDFDGAAYVLARALGIMDETVVFQTDAKHVFWSNNPLGNALNEMLEQLVVAGVLEKRDDHQYRWDKSFKGSWQ